MSPDTLEEYKQAKANRIAFLERELVRLQAEKDRREACLFCGIPGCRTRCQMY